MKAAVIGILCVAGGSIYVVGQTGRVHHERIVDESPQAVYKAFAVGAVALEHRRIENFKPRPLGMTAEQIEAQPGKTITFHTETVANKSVSVEVMADGEEIADIDFEIAPAAGGKTRLGATFDLDGRPLNMTPQFAMLEMSTGRMMDALARDTKRGSLTKYVDFDLATVRSMVDRVEAAQRGVTPRDPSQGVAMRRFESQRAMRDAARPMVNAKGYDPAERRTLDEEYDRIGRTGAPPLPTLPARYDRHR